MNLRWLVVINNFGPHSKFMPEELKKKTYNKPKLQQKIKGKWVDVPVEMITRKIPNDG